MNKRKLIDLFKKAFNFIGLSVSRSRARGKEVFPYYVDTNFPEIYKKYCFSSMVPWQGIYDAYEAAKYISINGVEGDIVECGVWKGGVSALMKEVLFVSNDKLYNERKFFLYDTFEGMSSPTSVDCKSGRDFEMCKRKYDDLLLKDGSSNWCRGEIKEVESTMLKTPGGMKNVSLVKGKVENTLLNQPIPKKISILRLDTDWYLSTKVELEVLWSRLVKGGVIIIDDYAAWSGARKAVNEFFDMSSFKGVFWIPNHYYGSLTGLKLEI